MTIAVIEIRFESFTSIGRRGKPVVPTRRRLANIANALPTYQIDNTQSMVIMMRLNTPI